MENKYMVILRRHDDSVLWEYPAEYDYKSEQNDFINAKKELESIFEMSFQYESGIQIQDASFHSSINLDSSLLVSSRSYAQVRFSNFGKLVTVSNECDVVSDNKAKILNSLLDLGYQYIPETVLSTSYTGTNPGVTGIDTWWVRYFDYV